MAGSGLDLLPFYAPDFYAKQLPIQRRAAMAQMLMQQGMSDPGTARYGGLRTAGAALAGALLGRRADTALGELYSGPENPGAGEETGQVTNAAQPNPDVQGNVPQSYEGTDKTNLFPELHNNPEAMAQPQPQAAPQAQPPAGQFSGIRGLNKRESMLMFFTDPGKYFETVAQQHGPTELMRNIEAAYPDNPAAQQAAYQQYMQKQTLTNEQLNARAAYPGNPSGAQSALQSGFQTPEVRNALAAHDQNLPEAARADVAAEVRKAGTQIYRPGQIVDLADGRRFQMPNEEGKFALFDKEGNPIFQGILPGATGNVQALSQAGAAGSEPEKIINVTRSDGSVVPMRAGSATGAQPSNFTPQQPPPLLGKGPITGSQPAPQSAPPPGIGQSTAQAELQKGAGQAAVEDAKFQPVIATARDAIKHALALNQNAPDSTFLSPEMKAEYAKRFGSNPFSSYQQQWNLDVNGVIVDAFKQIKSAGGRFPQALADEVIKANGVDFDQPRDARAFGLQRLDQLLQNFGAASQNTLAGMNAPGAANSTRIEPYTGAKGYQDKLQAPQPSAQELIDEARRRGLAK